MKESKALAGIMVSRIKGIACLIPASLTVGEIVAAAYERGVTDAARFVRDGSERDLGAAECVDRLEDAVRLLHRPDVAAVLMHPSGRRQNQGDA